MSASYAAGLTPSNMITASSIETSCIGANVSHRMYLPNGASNVAIQPSDNFRWNMSDPNNLAQIIEEYLSGHHLQVHLVILAGIVHLG